MQKHQGDNNHKTGDGRRLAAETEPDVTCKGAAFGPDFSRSLLSVASGSHLFCAVKSAISVFTFPQQLRVKLDSGVDQAVEDIDQKHHCHQERSKEDGNAHNGGVVALGHAVYKVIANAGNGEDLFNNKAAGQRPATVGPSTVMTGISALRRACLVTTANSVRPLARAVRM